MSRLKKLNIILAAVNAALLIAAGLFTAHTASLKREYMADSAKQAWDGGKYSYSQISLFFQKESSQDILGIYSLRRSVEEKLKEGSLTKAEDNPSGRLWIDCAGGEGLLSLSGSLGGCTAAVTGTFGDYFIFHPEKLMSGSYYTNDDINIDRIILDRECSWQLFGSMDTVGMPVNIGNKVFYVAGVVESPDKESDRLAYGITPRAYMPFESLKAFDDSVLLNSYEVCLPNAVKDYAFTMMKELNPAGDSGIIVDQSGRFDIVRLVKGVSELPESVMMNSGIRLPWYENRIRGAELSARLSAAPVPYLLIIPALSLVYALFMLTKLMGKGIRAVRDKAEDRYQKKISEIYFKKHEK
ncbi:MAG: ABC transporter permease [Oscillospiraceae bacterium]|nr:ABC transporter permease [Oscillospiraceae bacterium]